ncbi:MAG TPA: right-handed parallel beta-helix repeat-containing protein [Polyangia bacterium]
MMVSRCADGTSVAGSAATRGEAAPRAPRFGSGVVVMVSVVMALAAACTRDNPETCGFSPGDGCDDGFECIAKRCVKPDGGQAGGAGGGGGRGGMGGAGGRGGAGGGTSMDASDAPMGEPDGTDGPSDGRPLPDVGCETNAQCAGMAGRPFCVNGACRACNKPGMMADDQCQMETPFCTTTYQCVGCVEASRDRGDAGVCPMPTQHCEPTSSLCRECLTSTHCPTAMPICGTQKTCKPCTIVGEQPDPDACKTRNPALPACLPSGLCGECNTAKDCTKLDEAACSPTTNECGPCTKDKDCEGKGAGICITDPDGKSGRCATVEETIHVQPLPMGTCPSAVGSRNGSPANPFCRVSDAVAATTAMRRVLLLKGPGTLDPIVITNAGMPLHIIGKDRPVISAGAVPGIQVNATIDVRIRDLTIDDGDRVGVIAEGNATVRLNRCFITNNMGGGFAATQGAGFDISNTVFAGNGAALIGNVTFAGAYLGTPGGNRPRRFRFNTIVNHPGPGVVCADNTTEVVGLLTYMNSISDVAACRNTNSSPSADPLFSPSRMYHLSATSPFINKVPVSSAPPDDMDGEMRDDPMADWGADEYRPSF